MTNATPLPFDLPAVARKKLTVDFDGGNQSSDAGPAAAARGREEDRRRGAPAATMRDCRDPTRMRHGMSELVSARVFGHLPAAMRTATISTGCAHDPALKMAVGRCPETGAPLASQSTISRFENAPTKTDAARLARPLSISSPRT